LEAAVREHLVQPRGAKARVRFQRLAHQGKISIQHGGPQPLGAMKSLHLDGAFYRIGMNTELASIHAPSAQPGSSIPANSQFRTKEVAS
jgi:hypothetical protein